MTAFYNRYDDLSTFILGSNRFEMSPVPHVLIPVENRFVLSGETHGAEVQAEWRATDSWRLSAGYAWLQMNLAEGIDRDSPQHQFNVRSYLNLADNLELNAAANYASRTKHSNGIVPLTTPSYVKLDVGLTWRPTKSFELSVWGQNLLDDRHSEFFSFHTPSLIEVPRSVHAKLTFRF